MKVYKAYRNCGPQLTVSKLETKINMQEKSRNFLENFFTLLKFWRRTIRTMSLLLTIGFSMSACALGNVSSWKEETLLHDGTKLIVQRKAERAGRHEIGQRPAFANQSLTFNMPGSGQKITWEDKFSEDLGSANFLPMMLDVSNNTAYLVVYPMGCLSYNKWGRPNPPYIAFKYQNTLWQQIILEELPAELTVPNLIFSSPDEEAEKADQQIVSAEKIKQLYENYKQPEFKNIGRMELKYSYPGCSEMIYYKGMWMGPGDSIGKRMMDRKSK